MDLSWRQFESIHEHHEQYMFEVLARRLFKAKFKQVKDWPFSRPNNPGLEMPAVKDQESGDVVGFQAKYFQVPKLSSTQYREIKESAEKAVHHYVKLALPGENLTRFYLYCNRKLDTNHKNYVEIKQYLEDNGVELICICDDAVLDEASQLGENIRKDFFDPDSKWPDWYIYYAENIEEFEKKQDESVLGNQSLAESYIQPEISEGPLLDYLEQWSYENSYGVLLLHGEPGDGKTTLCRKAVYDFAKKKRFIEARGVFWFPLNDAKSHIIIPDGGVQIEKAFHMEGESENILSLKDAEEMLIFLDGYDEIKLHLEEMGIGSFQNFWDPLLKTARRRKIHFVITSRSSAIESFFLNDHLSYCFLPLTYEKQKEWVYSSNRQDSAECITYWEEKLDSICKREPSDPSQKAFYELLQIPFVFRMVVNQRYSLTGSIKNKAKLYEDLFVHTIHRREPLELITGKTEQEIVKEYDLLAYRIWRYNDDMARITDEMQSGKNVLLFSYYLKEEYGKQNRLIGYIHRSIYQYFLADYLARKLASIKTEDTAEQYLGLLGSERIDKDVLLLISQIFQNRIEEGIWDEEELKKSCAIIFHTMVSTQLYISEANYEEVAPETRKRKRQNHIFCNAMNICFCLDVVSEFNDCSEIKDLFHDFRELRLYISGREDKYIDLSGVYVEGADMNDSIYSYVDFCDANLEGCCLSDTELCGSLFDHTQMNHIDLRDASLSKAKILFASLEHADLKGADLSNSIIKNSKFSHSDLTYMKLENAQIRNCHFEDSDLLNTTPPMTEIVLHDKEAFNSSLRGAIQSDTFWQMLKIGDSYLFGHFVFITKKNKEWTVLAKDDTSRQLLLVTDGCFEFVNSNPNIKTTMSVLSLIDELYLSVGEMNQLIPYFGFPSFEKDEPPAFPRFIEGDKLKDFILQIFEDRGDRVDIDLTYESNHSKQSTNHYRIELSDIDYNDDYRLDSFLDENEEYVRKEVQALQANEYTVICIQL